VLNPEAALLLVKAGDGEVSVGHRVGEEGGVEVKADVSGVGPVDPALEQADVILVAVDLAAVFLRVDSMQRDLHGAGNAGKRDVEVAAELVCSAGSAGIIAGSLNAAGQSLGTFKAKQVVALPAVHGDGDGVDGGHRLFCVDTVRSVNLLRQLIPFANQRIVHKSILSTGAQRHTRHII